jgi:hypothetical protein
MHTANPCVCRFEGYDKEGEGGEHRTLTHVPSLVLTRVRTCVLTHAHACVLTRVCAVLCLQVRGRRL